MDAEAGVTSLVAVFEDAANRHAIDEVLAIFTDEAVFELAGVVRLSGKREIRAVFEYDAGVHCRLQLVNRRATAQGVTCQIIEINDRISAAGLDVLLYSPVELFFEATRICLWRAVPEPWSTRAFNEYWSDAAKWLAAHCPADYARLFTPDARFIRTRDNGERIVELVKEYHPTGTPV